MEPDDDADDWWTRVPARTLQSALTLAQTTWWVDSEGTPYLVDSMTDAHRRAVLDYLREHSRELLLDVQETYARATPASAPYGAARTLLAGDPALPERAAWLEATPLVRRLQTLTRN